MVAIAKEFRLGSDFPTIDHATWQKQVEADLKGVPFAKRMLSHSYEGIELQALYTEEMFPTAGDPAGLPGYPPFIRGAQPLGNVLDRLGHSPGARASRSRRRQRADPRGSQRRRDLH